MDAAAQAAEPIAMLGAGVARVHPTPDAGTGADVIASLAALARLREAFECTLPPPY
jgi:hypothetical protein